MALFGAFRLAGAGFKLARAGLYGYVDPATLPAGADLAIRLARLIEKPCKSDDERAERVSRVFNELGPSYIKFGQFLSTRADIVGPEMALALASLKDDIPAFGRPKAVEVIEATFDARLDDLFQSFSEPIAAASIAQVHRAVLKPDPDGLDDEPRARAIKVLRPGVRKRFKNDLASYFAAARLIDRFVPPARRLKPLDVVATLDRSATLEMDLRIEAAALSEMAEKTARDPGFRVPKVDWSLTGRDVLAIEWIDGVKLSDIAGIDAAGHDRKALAATVMQSFLRHALRDGFFHADMHEGNLFVEADGTLVAVDFGIMGRLGAKERRFLAEILYGFIRRDYMRIAEVHFEAGYVPATHAVEDFAQALRAVGEPIQGKQARDISMAKLLGLLFEITDLFDMATRPELIMLQKTMVVVEGVARKLDADFNMWQTADPVVSEWMAANLGPASRLRDVADGAGALARLAGQLPALATRAGELSQAFAGMARDGMVLDPRTVAAIADAEAARTRSGRIATWIGALALVGILLAVL